MAKKTAKKGIVKGELVIPRGRVGCPLSIELVIPRGRLGCPLSVELVIPRPTKAASGFTAKSAIPRGKREC